MSQQNKKDEKNLDKENSLTDYDLCELYLRSVEIFVETCSRLDIESHKCFDFGQVLWKKSLEAREEYRKSHPFHVERSSTDK